jgi:hypothetical protein
VVLGEEIRDDRPSERADFLNQAVWTRLKAKYVRENKLEPTEEEIEEFLEGSRRAKEKSRAGWKERRERLQTELAGDDLNDQQRVESEERLKTLERLLESDLQDEADREQMTPEEREDLKRFERDMARDWVTRWKVNNSLFEKCGGRVMFQQAGMEPYDAYRQFLTDQEKAGAFKILDEELREEYWAEWPEDPPGPKAFVSEGEQAKSAISKRWWVEGVKEKEEGEAATMP